jgi:ABC-type multidrug transport system fused ATPase/permease subunit
MLEGGKIVDYGPREELLRKEDGPFKTLYNNYSKH